VAYPAWDQLLWRGRAPQSRLGSYEATWEKQAMTPAPQDDPPLTMVHDAAASPPHPSEVAPGSRLRRMLKHPGVTPGGGHEGHQGKHGPRRTGPSPRHRHEKG
jgi:hypothetical protein